MAGAKKKTEVDPEILGLFPSQPSRGELRKAQIIQAALKCVAELGIERTTFESIGKEIGIGKAHVAYHFKDKSEIIEKCIEYAYAVGRRITVERVEAAASPLERIDAYASAAFEWLASNPHFGAAVLLFHYYCACVPRLARLQVELRRVGAERCRGFVAALGTVPAREQEETAKAIQLLITGALTEVLTTIPPARYAEALEESRLATLRSIRRLLGAAEAGAPPHSPGKRR